MNSPPAKRAGGETEMNADTGKRIDRNKDMNKLEIEDRITEREEAQRIAL